MAICNLSFSMGIFEHTEHNFLPGSKENTDAKKNQKPTLSFPTKNNGDRSRVLKLHAKIGVLISV